MLKNENTTKPLSVIWTISLISLPIAFTLLFVSSEFLQDNETNQFLQMTFTASSFTLFLFALINIIFSFFTISVFWKELSNIKKFLYVCFSIVFNVLSPYVITKLWSNAGVNVYSFKGKVKFGVFPIFVYIVLFIIFMLSNFLSKYHV